MDATDLAEIDVMVVEVVAVRSNAMNVVNEVTLPEIAAIDEIADVVVVTDVVEVETDMIEAVTDMIAVVIDTIAAEIVIVQERDVTETEVKTETDERVEIEVYQTIAVRSHDQDHQATIEIVAKNVLITTRTIMRTQIWNRLANFPLCQAYLF